MSTAISHTMSRQVTTARASVVIDPRDYWNESLDRPKSGYFKVAMTGSSFTWTNTGGGTERVNVKIGLPNHNPNHDKRHEFDVTVSTGTVGTFTNDFKVAWNYGVPGPGAMVLPDGNVELLRADLELLSGDDSAVTALDATLTYTLTFIEFDPYSVLSESWNMSSWSITLTPKGDAVRTGLIVAPSAPTDVILLQLRSTTSAYTPKGAAPPVPPRLTVSTNNGVLADHGISGLPSSVVTYRDNYTLVVCANDGKLDANAALVVTGGSSGGTTSRLVAQAALTTQAREDELSSTLAYDIASDPTAI